MEATRVAPASSRFPARIFCLLLPVACVCFAIRLGFPGSVYAPDSAQYRLLALGQRALVPAPFSARILGPAIAGLVGHFTGLGVDTGFLALGVVSLLVFVAFTAAYLWSWQAPAAMFAAVFLMPFWVDMFHDYYLPDLLHAALLAAILACLYYGYTAAGLLLLLPAYLARESTILVAVCLVFAGWRRIPVRTAAVGLFAVLAAGMVSGHYGHGGPASVHGLSGGIYILGKLFWSFFKNVLGLPLWSNTLPECDPVWSTGLSRNLHLGSIQSVGVCSPSLWGPGRILLAWCGVFGLGPACALTLRPFIFRSGALGGRLWHSHVSASAGEQPGELVVFRFCIVYGLISLFMTPLLGASADRLVEYGWPFCFAVLPWFLYRNVRLEPWRAAALLSLHLLTCWLAWFGFRQGSGFVAFGLAAFALNGLGYSLLRAGRTNTVTGDRPGYIKPA